MSKHKIYNINDEKIIIFYININNSILRCIYLYYLLLYFPIHFIIYNNSFFKIINFLGATLSFLKTAREPT